MNNSKLNSILRLLFQWLKAYLPSVVWAAVIFIISSQEVLPGSDVFFLDFLIKKSAHMFVYGVLYWLLWRAVSQTISQKHQTALWLLPMVVCLLYAASDELHQSFVPGRYATLRDVGFDMLGVGVVFLKKFKYI